jgi:hypothetical protein
MTDAVETIDNKVDELRSQIELVLQQSEILAKAMIAVGEKLDSKTNALEQRVDLGFADTQAMIKFSHAELDRRVRFMEQTLTVLEEKFANLNRRVDRLEETERTEN